MGGPHGGDRVAGREGRGERRARLLKRHRDLVAADAAQLFGREREQVAAFQLDQAAGADVAGRLGDEAQQGQRGNRLAAPRFPHDAEGLPGVQVERHAVHGAGRATAALGDEIRLQVPDPEKWFRHIASRLKPRLGDSR